MCIPMCSKKLCAWEHTQHIHIWRISLDGMLGKNDIWEIQSTLIKQQNVLQGKNTLHYVPNISPKSQHLHTSENDMIQMKNIVINSLSKQQKKTFSQINFRRSRVGHYHKKNSSSTFFLTKWSSRSNEKQNWTFLPPHITLTKKTYSNNNLRSYLTLLRQKNQNFCCDTHLVTDLMSPSFYIYNVLLYSPILETDIPDSHEKYNCACQ